MLTHFIFVLFSNSSIEFSSAESCVVQVTKPFLFPIELGEHGLTMNQYIKEKQTNMHKLTGNAASQTSVSRNSNEMRKQMRKHNRSKKSFNYEMYA